MSKLVRILNGLKLCKLNFKPFQTIIHGLWFLFLMAIIQSVANGFIKLSSMLMELLNGTKPALWLEASLNEKTLIIRRHLLLLPKSLQYIAFSPWSQSDIGFFIKWMSRTPFFMMNLLKRCTNNLYPGLLDRGSTRCVD